jgi:hypothetical protein
MRIDELDEFQGLTPDMVRAWLANLDPSIKPSACIGGDIEAVSELCGETSQSLLREINPRMRKGIPSQEALRAHRGLWLRSLGKENIATVLSRQLEEFPSPRDAESCFWPCDENYNKTRWPTDANGVML